LCEAAVVIAFGCLFVLGAFAESAAGFRAVLWFNAIIFAVLALLVIIFIPNFDKKLTRKQKAELKQVASESQAESQGEAALEQEAQAESSIAILKTMFKQLKNPGVWVCIGVIMCGFCLWSTTNGYMGTYCTRVLGIDPSISSALSIVRSYLIVFIAGVTGGVVMDKFKTKGKGMMVAFLATTISVALVFITRNAIFVCLAVTLVLAYMVNVLKSTYWSIMGDAGITRAETGTATAIISLIALTPDIFVSPIIGPIINYWDAAGSVETGFNIMLVWMLVWAALGIGAGLILKKRKQALDKAQMANGAEKSKAAAAANAA